MTPRLRGAVVLFVAALGAAPAAQVDRLTAIRAAFDIMTEARYCTMVTNGTDGHPQSRIVDPVISAGEQRIYVATNPESRKVKEIQRDGRVTLTFLNAPANEYVTVLGRARIVTDAASKAAHWKVEWQPFYKDGSRGADFMLFEVTPFRLEISSPGRKMNNDERTWRPVVIELPVKE